MTMCRVVSIVSCRTLYIAVLNCTLLCLLLDVWINQIKGLRSSLKIISHKNKGKEKSTVKTEGKSRENGEKKSTPFSRIEYCPWSLMSLCCHMAQQAKVVGLSLYPVSLS